MDTLSLAKKFAKKYYLYNEIGIINVYFSNLNNKTKKRLRKLAFKGLTRFNNNYNKNNPINKVIYVEKTFSSTHSIQYITYYFMIDNNRYTIYNDILKGDFKYHTKEVHYINLSDFLKSKFNINNDYFINKINETNIYIDKYNNDLEILKKIIIENTEKINYFLKTNKLY